MFTLDFDYLILYVLFLIILFLIDVKESMYFGDAVKYLWEIDPDYILDLLLKDLYEAEYCLLSQAKANESLLLEFIK